VVKGQTKKREKALCGSLPLYIFGLMKSVFHQLAVTDALGLFQTEALELVGLVVGVASFKEEHAAVSLISQDVGADAVQEPAVVADDHSTACKVLQAFLQCAKGVHVNVVGGLVE